MVESLDSVTCQLKAFARYCESKADSLAPDDQTRASLYANAQLLTRYATGEESSCEYPEYFLLEAKTATEHMCEQDVEAAYKLLGACEQVAIDDPERHNRTAHLQSYVHNMRNRFEVVRPLLKNASRIGRSLEELEDLVDEVVHCPANLDFPEY